MSKALKKRVFSGVLVALSFVIIMAYFPGPLQFALLLAFALACQAEFYTLAIRGGFRVYNKLGCFLGMLWFFAVYALDVPAATPETSHPLIPGWESALLFTCCFTVLMRTMFDEKVKNAFTTSAITFLGILYGPVMLSYYMRLAQWDASSAFVTTRAGVFLTFYISMIIKMSDTGAFAIGTACGRHKMFPRVSPKKSWEGLIGGVSAGISCGVFTAWLAARYQWGPSGVFYCAAGTPILTLQRAALLSAALVIVGLFGDLIESMYKRTVKIKDSSSIFPGMGGLLDVVDSLIFAPPVMYFFLIWVSKIYC